MVALNIYSNVGCREQGMLCVGGWDGVGGEQEVDRNSLHFLLSLTVNLKLLKK